MTCSSPRFRSRASLQIACLNRSFRWGRRRGSRALTPPGCCGWAGLAKCTHSASRLTASRRSRSRPVVDMGVVDPQRSEIRPFLVAIDSRVPRRLLSWPRLVGSPRAAFFVPPSRLFLRSALIAIAAISVAGRPGFRRDIGFFAVSFPWHAAPRRAIARPRKSRRPRFARTSLRIFVLPL